MLVLSRKRGEEIIIGDNIRITVVETRGAVVRLGITAPRDVNIVRAELLANGKNPKATPQGPETS
tara:strand:+ start:255 stop:449 length:195 start_codon:yes stop_codon:yes gene_type:complete